MKGEQTLPKSRRITRSGDYRQIKEEGQRYHTTNFVVIIRPGQTDKRLGLTVSRKVGNAVCRNRLKRWIREYFRKHQWRSESSLDVSVIAKQPAGSLSHLQLDRELSTVFARLETDYHD